MSQQRIHWPYIIAAYLALFSFGFLDNVRGPFFPNILKDMNLTDGQGSWFFAIASFIAFFGSYLAPWVLRLVGSLSGLRLGLLAIIVGFFSMSFAGGLTGLLVASACFGMGLGLLQVFQHTCIQDGANRFMQRRLFNGLHSMYALSALFAPVVTAGLFAVNWTWRESFQLFCVLPLLALIYSFFVRTVRSEHTNNHHVKASRSELIHIIYVATIVALYVTAELSISTRLVLYVQRVLTVSDTFSTMYLTLFFLLLFAGRLTFVFFDFKNWRNQKIIVMALGLSLVFYVAVLTINPWFLSVCGFTMAPVFAVSMDWIGDLFGEKASLGISLALAIGSLFIVSMHNLVGYLSDVYGIRLALAVGPCFLLVSLVLAALHSKFFSSI